MKKLKAPAMKKPETKKSEYESTYDERPSLHITTKELPEIASWEVGKTYDLNIRVHMDSKNKSANSTDQSATLRITHIGVEEKE